MQHPPTTQLSHLHQQSATRAVYDNPPVIESSRRPLLLALLRLSRAHCGRREASVPPDSAKAGSFTSW